MEGDSPTLQFIGYWASRIYEHRDLIQMQIHMFLAALFPIYIGSHASLRRPPSASKPEKKTVTDGPSEADDEDFDDETVVEGFTPSDAILFPILASVTLGGLYLLIKWLKDPELLNKILGGYFSFIGVFGVGKLLGDALNVATTFIFPSVWSSREGLYCVDPLRLQQLLELSTRTDSDSRSKKSDKSPVDSVNQTESTSASEAAVPLQVKDLMVTRKSTPFPGFLSQLQVNENKVRWLWSVRALFKDHAIFNGYVHGLMNIKAKVLLNDFIGLIFGLLAIFLYNSGGKAWWLSNLMGTGFCYGTLQLMSPTTFWTGSLVLCGLFIYDIVMVFYTPLMVTVATTLDVPIKLIFPGPNRGGMLGLGDIVLPGIMIALALRYDLYLHYLRKQNSVNSAIRPLDQRTLPNTSSPNTIKPSYQDATGRWGERFWTYRTPRSSLPAIVQGAVFSKTYFYASIVGYSAGMLVTVIILNIFKHAQPALLYLVPSVLGSLWGTAFVRGELSLMWNYTEDGSLEESEQKSTELKNDGTVEKAEKGDGDGKEIAAKKGATGNDKEDQTKLDARHEIFVFSLSTPRREVKAEKVIEKSS